MTPDERMTALETEFPDWNIEWAAHTQKWVAAGEGDAPERKDLCYATVKAISKTRTGKLMFGKDVLIVTRNGGQYEADGALAEHAAITALCGILAYIELGGEGAV